MKKILLGFMVVALTVALSMSVMATPHEAWEWISVVGGDTGGYWRSMANDGVKANARAFSSNPKVGSCNKARWEVQVTVHASVAQWVDWSISGTRYDWQIRKPGEYAANSLTASLASNGDVAIQFDGFGNLYSADSMNKEIETWYAYGPGPVGNVTWIPAASLDGVNALVKDSLCLHTGYDWKLWNRIRVVECNSACEYQNDATITLVLDNLKPWIDPDTGDFLSP